MKIESIGILAVLLLTFAPAGAQDANESDIDLDLTKRYLLLATSKTSTMQEEMSVAAAAGYRVLLGTRLGTGELGVLMEKLATPDERHEYLLLATQRTKTMRKELEAAANQGFRIIPQAMMGGESEIVLVLERAPDAMSAPEYVMLATKKTGKLAKEIREEVDRGFELLGLLSRKEHMAFLVRGESAAPGTSETEAGKKRKKSEDYKLLATKKTSTMEKELRKAAEKGHCVIAGAPTSGAEYVLLMKKMQERATPCEYHLLAANDTAQLGEELNASAAAGYRLLPQTIAGKKSAGGWLSKTFVPGGDLLHSALAPDEILFVTEKLSDPDRRYEYILLDSTRTSTMQEEVSQCADEGFEILAMVGGPNPKDELTFTPVANVIVVMEREVVR